jgi:uncharacterized membrane protein
LHAILFILFVASLVACLVGSLLLGLVLLAVPRFRERAAFILSVPPLFVLGIAVGSWGFLALTYVVSVPPPELQFGAWLVGLPVVAYAGHRLGHRLHQYLLRRLHPHREPVSASAP